ncbi:B3 domain-containing protein [Striga asiatica]|uniref:B3 domain-containing protein n=1 Tax=Striga asiatica TaxID=4170 RepID=A0A5A7QWR7_STRAF|nr:B3 domain-containing protein [Striga asiatica]
MKLEESPSFFKVLIMDFNHQLCIPPDFSREHERVLVASTRTTLRVSSGATWDVKVEKMGDGNYKFTEGWGEFARDVGLQLGEFMAFWLVGKSLFDVAIFSVSGCDREFPLLDDEFADDDPVDGDTKLRRRRNTFFKILFGDDFTRRLRIPPEFARNRAGPLLGKAKLEISGGTTWAVNLEKMEDGNIWFCKGWTEFIEDMELKLFDFLIFIWCSEKSTFQVSGYGKNACAKGTFQGSARLENDLEEEAYSCSDGEDEAKSGSSNPRFKIIMKPQHVYRLHVPKDFLLAAGLIGKKRVCLDYEGGHPVCVELKSRRRIGFVEMVNGWPKFQTSNNLVLGKSYTFEFIPSKMIIQVHGENKSSDDVDNSDADETKYPIHDKERKGKGRNQEIVKKRNGKAKSQENMEGHHSKNCDRLKEERPNFDGSSSDIKETWDAYQKAEDFVSRRTKKNPFFISLMHTSHVGDNHGLNVPFPFGRRNLPHLSVSSIVLVTNGKEWLVKCRKGKRRAALLTAGWRKFVQDNGIKLGDACVFEVADRIDSKGNDLVWDVFIFRN